MRKLTRNPPPFRGASSTLPSCASAIRSTIGKAEADSRALGADAFVADRESRLGLDSADQLRVRQRAMRFKAFREIVSMSTVTLPVAGSCRNFNPPVSAGFAGKTGSDSAAGGYLALFTHPSKGTSSLPWAS